MPNLLILLCSSNKNKRFINTSTLIKLRKMTATTIKEYLETLKKRDDSDRESYEQDNLTYLNRSMQAREGRGFWSALGELGTEIGNALERSVKGVGKVYRGVYRVGTDIGPAVQEGVKILDKKIDASKKLKDLKSQNPRKTRNEEEGEKILYGLLTDSAKAEYDSYRPDSNKAHSILRDSSNYQRNMTPEEVNSFKEALREETPEEYDARIRGMIPKDDKTIADLKKKFNKDATKKMGAEMPKDPREREERIRGIVSLVAQGINPAILYPEISMQELGLARRVGEEFRRVRSKQRISEIVRDRLEGASEEELKERYKEDYTSQKDTIDKMVNRMTASQIAQLMSQGLRYEIIDTILGEEVSQDVKDRFEQYQEYKDRLENWEKEKMDEIEQRRLEHEREMFESQKEFQTIMNAINAYISQYGGGIRDGCTPEAWIKAMVDAINNLRQNRGTQPPKSRNPRPRFTLP